MLILARDKDQGIIINGNIKIVFKEVKSGNVKLGIEAPKEITIRKEEGLFTATKPKKKK